MVISNDCTGVYTFTTGWIINFPTRDDNNSMDITFGHIYKFYAKRFNKRDCRFIIVEIRGKVRRYKEFQHKGE